MIEKDFWRKAKVAVVGGGSFGTVLAHIAAKNCLEVRLWIRNEDQARAINSTRINAQYAPELKLHEKISAVTSLERVFEGGVQALIWVLPSTVCRAQAKLIAPLLTGEEVVLHATKGVEPQTLKRVSEIFREELPTARVGVISGPNLAHEMARNEPAATVVASPFDEVIEAGRSLLTTDRFRIYGESDLIGVEWAGTLKNILAIASGALDGLNLGSNARALLITRGLAEIVRFGVAMGAKQATFLSLAGIGDLLATCSSPLSRNYRVGYNLAKGERLEKILKELGTTAEGVATTRNVWGYASHHGIEMPITEGVFKILEEGHSVHEVLDMLMVRPPVP
jgi:glycerol-3-phosphate dehydrogenase (NAD(P)+)